MLKISPEITVSRFSSNDIEEMTAIYNHYVENTTATFELRTLSADDMARRVSEIAHSFPCLVARTADGELAGYCYAHSWKSFAAYATTLETTVYLRPDMTTKGIGRKLMKMLIEECRQCGAHVLIACITAENEGSVRFHESLGFEAVSHFRQVGRKFDRWLDVIDMQLTM